MRRDARAFELRVEPDTWWSYWHYHADWPGWGNHRWRYRLEHLRALAIVFRTIVEAAPRMPVPFQTWWVLDGEDAGQDAVFLHSPNPNPGSEFPMQWGAIEWGAATELEAVFAELLPGLPLRIGRAGDRVVVYAPGVGVPLE